MGWSFSGRPEQRQGPRSLISHESFAPGLVILDTLARTMVGGDETGAAGTGSFIDNAERLGRALGATVMPVR